MKLLVVEDNRTNLLVLKGILQKMDGCEIEAFADPLAALERAKAELFDLILVDYMMPGLDGRSFIQILRQREDYRHIPMVMITADSNRQTLIDSITAGATDFLYKPVDPIELKARIGNLLTLRRQQRDLTDRAAWLADEVTKATLHLAEREEEVIWRLSRALAFRDDDTGEHTSRVANVSRMIGEELGLDPQTCRTLYLAAPLHDIGKVAIPDSLLLKPGPLTVDEITIMRRHVPIGEEILSGGSSDLVKVAAELAASHHERWDGRGYPRGLAGPAIPLVGRIAAVADVFDALCSVRPYKSPWPLDRARAEIRRGAGSQFDPACVDAFERRWTQIAAIYAPSPASAVPLSMSA